MPQAIDYYRPKLTDYQTRAFFNDSRYCLVEAGTKSGKTFAGMAWLFEQAAAVAKNKNYWWLAPVYPQASVAYRRLKDAVPVELRKANDSDLTLTLPNGRTIWFKSGEKPDNLYGEDVGAAVIDEASRLREESWHAMRSTLTATRGPIRIVGNIKGKRNWFYRLARHAEAGAADMAYAKFSSMDAAAAGIISQADIEDARRVLPEAVFNELYMAIPSDDGGNPFGIQHIAACVAPLSVKPAVAFGVDLAKSVDYTVVVGLDHDGKTCCFERWQSPWKETIQRVRGLVGASPALVDASGVGDPIVEALQREPGSYARFEAFKFTSESKQQLMEGLAVAIQRGSVRFPAGTLVNELEQFEYEYTRTGVKYNAPQGAFDDCVCALALAVKLYSDRGTLRPVAAMSGRPGQQANRRPDWL